MKQEDENPETGVWILLGTPNGGAAKVYGKEAQEAIYTGELRHLEYLMKIKEAYEKRNRKRAHVVKKVSTLLIACLIVGMIFWHFFLK